jgi:FKBP-type peptidyl-prolyl cis-trans isomerase FklB
MVLFLGVTGFAQKKKDLIQEVAKLKVQSTELQAKLKAFEATKKVNLQDSLQNFSYAFGVSIGNNLKTIGFDSIAYNTFAVAIEDAMKGKEKIALADAQRIIQSTLQKAQEVEAKEKSAEGSKFLAENGKRPEIITTESGLEYEILRQGDGDIPIASDRIKVHYTGMLLDGTIFDSSVERGEPAVFGVTQVIKGWQEALQLMPVGSKWMVFIPQEIAYGPNGRGATIPPYSVLMFEMELLGIE